MGSPESDKIFVGSIPKLYEEYLVPLIFQPYAEDLANRLASRTVSRVLEIAAGTVGRGSNRPAIRTRPRRRQVQARIFTVER